MLLGSAVMSVVSLVLSITSGVQADFTTRGYLMLSVCIFFLAEFVIRVLSMVSVLIELRRDNEDETMPYSVVDPFPQ